MKLTFLPQSSVRNSISIIGLLLVSCMNTEKDPREHLGASDEVEIRKIHQDYVSGWNDMDEEKVMGLLEANAQIQPNRMTPIQGKDEIREFWFPKDSSTTTINRYETEILYLKIMDTIAITTHNSLLDWDYQKDTTNLGMIQRGFNTTVYRKQPDHTWKIWRSMWTDISADRK